MTLRYLAPAGSPIRVRDLGAWVSSMATVQDARQALARAVAERVQVPHVFLTCTGRAGLAILCRALARLGPASATEVIIPSYTCYSVPASIARAGLTPRLVDVDPDTLDYDRAALEATDGARVLAIVATNLYGHPNDLPWLAAWARARGCFLVDDAAQALGASVGGRASGTWGDAGLYSLDKGKNVSAIDGGVLVTGRHDVAAALQAELQALPEPARGTRAGHVLKTFVYAGLLHPRLYWIPNGIPQLGLGRTEYRTDFALERADPALAALGLVMLDRLDAFTAHRTATARAIEAGWLGRGQPAGGGLRLPRVTGGAASAWLRFPVLARDRQHRAALLEELTRRGIGATASYPLSLADVPELAGVAAGLDAPLRGGREVAARILTLPTHPFVRPRDVATIVDVLACTPAAAGGWRAPEALPR